VSAGDPLADSKPFAITNLIEGEHTVRAKHACGVDTRVRIQIARGEDKQAALRLWVADTEVLLKDGSKKVGMLTEKNAQGDIVLKESSKKSERLLNPDIAKITPLSMEQIRKIMEKVRPLDMREKEPPAGGGPIPADTPSPAGHGGNATVEPGAVGGEDDEARPAKALAPAEKRPTKIQGVVGEE